MSPVYSVYYVSGRTPWVSANLNFLMNSLVLPWCYFSQKSLWSQTTLVRRLIRCASEDIGLADPKALEQVLAAKDAFERLGSPEGELAIAQTVAYLATAPKSNAVYTAYKKL